MRPVGRAAVTRPSSASVRRRARSGRVWPSLDSSPDSARERERQFTRHVSILSQAVSCLTKWIDLNRRYDTVYRTQTRRRLPPPPDRCCGRLSELRTRLSWVLGCVVSVCTRLG